MKSGRRTAGLSLLVLLPAVAIMFVGAPAQAQDVGDFLVRLRSEASINRIAWEYGLTVIDSVPDRNVYEVMANDPTKSDSVFAALSNDRRVIYCDDDDNISQTDIVASPFHLAFDLTPDPGGYKSQQAYYQIGSVLSGGGLLDFNPIGVAILDTGANTAHPALAGRLLQGFNALAPGTPPLDLPDGVNNVAVGHGTMVTGIVAAVSPHAMLMPVRVLNGDGVGFLINVLQGIHYAVAHGVRVINMSFSTTVPSIALMDALEEARRADIVLVASAGNDYDNLPHYPAAYDWVLGVGSVEADNTLSSYSDFGTGVSFVAPGSDITSTYWDGNYASWSGTSFAAPFVAALSSELISEHPGWSAKHVAHRMARTAHDVDPLNPGFETMLGAGLIDFASALKSHDDHHDHDD